MSVFLILLVAVVADQLLKEPKRFHPLVGFGYLAEQVELYLNSRNSTSSSRLSGLFAFLLMLVPLLLVGEGLESLFGVWVAAPLLYLAVGHASLAEHAEKVSDALQENNLRMARQRVGWIVSRETGELNKNQVARAATESVLENGCDAVFGVIFWYLVAGIPGIIIYRLTNTLDAMWGYRNERYRDFGWAAAKFDDLLNWIPARLTAFSYALIGETEAALRCWKDQARGCESPNGGPVMAAGAGALGVILGGDGRYRGEVKIKPILGEGEQASVRSIGEAIELVRKSLLLWLVVIFIVCSINA